MMMASMMTMMILCYTSLLYNKGYCVIKTQRIHSQLLLHCIIRLYIQFLCAPETCSLEQILFFFTLFFCYFAGTGKLCVTFFFFFRSFLLLVETKSTVRTYLVYICNIFAKMLRDYG